MMAFFRWMADPNSHRWLSVAVALLTSVPIFYDLGKSPVYMWDEAVYAGNALEMAENGNPLVLYNRGEISHYNVKPPFAIWLQALSLKLLGYHEWALRFPSALAAWITAMMVFFFGRITLRSNLTGAVAALILVSVTGFIRPHLARSADLDAVLVCWVTGYSLLMFHFLIHGKPSLEKTIRWMAVGVVGAFYTKSVAAFLPVPGLILAVGVSGKLPDFLRLKGMYLAVVAGIVMCGLYVFLREWASPGYVTAVWRSEYMRLGTSVMPWHEHPFDFYLRNFFERNFFMPYLFLLPLAWIPWRNSQEGKKAVRLLTVSTLAYLLFISLPKVKLEWYDSPVYPALSLLTAMGLVGLVKTLVEGMQLPKSGVALAAGIAWLGLFSLNFGSLSHELTSHLPRDPLEREGYYLRETSTLHPEWKHLRVYMEPVVPEHLDQAWFYVHSINLRKKTNHHLVTDRGKLAAGDTVLICQQNLIAWVDSLTQFRILDQQDQLRIGIMP